MAGLVPAIFLRRASPLGRGRKECPDFAFAQSGLQSTKHGGKRRQERGKRSSAMTFRIAVVQPISHRPGDDERNVADAERAIERAAGEGAHFVCFPATYPGPWRMPATYDPTAALP